MSSKIHIKDKYSEYPRKSLCNSKSWFLDFADKLSNVTRRTCKYRFLLNKGKISEMPFGGNYKSDGTLRDNVNGDRWK